MFLSDEHRFARGDAATRLTKYALYRAGLWPLVWRLRTHGRGYHLTEGDGGVSYLIPTVPTRSSWFHPLFSATHILVCAMRDA